MKLRRHPAAFAVALAIGLSVTGAAYAAATATTTQNSVVASDTQVEQGKQLFMEGCSSCHGLAARVLPMALP